MAEKRFGFKFADHQEQDGPPVTSLNGQQIPDGLIQVATPASGESRSLSDLAVRAIAAAYSQGRRLNEASTEH